MEEAKLLELRTTVELKLPITLVMLVLLMAEYWSVRIR